MSVQFVNSLTGEEISGAHVLMFSFHISHRVSNYCLGGFSAITVNNGISRRRRQCCMVSCVHRLRSASRTLPRASCCRRALNILFTTLAAPYVMDSTHNRVFVIWILLSYLVTLLTLELQSPAQLEYMSWLPFQMVYVKDPPERCATH